MHDNNLPVGPAANEARPTSRAEAARPTALVVERRPGTLSLDLLSDENREESAGADLMGYWNILVKRRWLAKTGWVFFCSASVAITWPAFWILLVWFISALRLSG